MHNLRIIGRKAATAAGLNRYFTGKPCNLGGIAERIVSDKKCQCEAHQKKRAENASQRYIANRQVRLEKQSKYYADNKSAVNEYGRLHYAKNKNLYVLRAKSWADDNKQKVLAAARNWAARNPGMAAANVHARRARQLNAIPNWFGEFDEMVMVEALDLAGRRYEVTGIKWEMDHIIPLAGKTVCGLHIAENIQVIPRTANRKKSNTFAVI